MKSSIQLEGICTQDSIFDWIMGITDEPTDQRFRRVEDIDIDEAFSRGTWT